MRARVIIGLMILVLGDAAVTYAQATPATLSTDPQQIEALIQAQGCRAEVSASAQTIAQLQKQINELKAQLSKLDPPKKK